MLIYRGTFELYSELAIAVAGFAAVAVALGGRDRAFGQMELVRIQALFAYSALVLAGCFGLFSLAAAEVNAVVAIRVVSFGEAIGFALYGAASGPGAIRLTQPNDSWVPYFVMGTYGANILICLVNGVVLAREWPLIATFSITILLSLFLFYRLITRTR